MRCPTYPRAFALAVGAAEEMHSPGSQNTEGLVTRPLLFSAEPTKETETDLLDSRILGHYFFVPNFATSHYFAIRIQIKSKLPPSELPPSVLLIALSFSERKKNTEANSLDR